MAAEAFYSKLGLPKHLISLTVDQDRRVDNKVTDIIASTHWHRLEPQRPPTSTYQDEGWATVAISEMTDTDDAQATFMSFEVRDLDTGSHLPSETDVMNIPSLLGSFFWSFVFEPSDKPLYE